MIQASPGLFPHHIKEGAVLSLKSEKYQIEKKILHFRITQNIAIVRFEGINSIQAALKLIGYNAFFEDGENRTSNNHRANLAGFTVEDMKKRKWGIVINISQHHMNEVMEVFGEDHSYLIPFHPDIIKNIDTENRMITIDPPAGLEDINK